MKKADPDKTPSQKENPVAEKKTKIAGDLIRRYGNALKALADS